MSMWSKSPATLGFSDSSANSGGTMSVLSPRRRMCALLILNVLGPGEVGAELEREARARLGPGTHLDTRHEAIGAGEAIGDVAEGLGIDHAWENTALVKSILVMPQPNEAPTRSCLKG